MRFTSLMTTAENLPRAISKLRRQRDETQGKADYYDHQLRQMIRAALEAEWPVVDVAEAAGMSRQRVYQIRNGRR